METQLLVENDASHGLPQALIDDVETPALIYDETRLETLLRWGIAAKRKAGFKLLYAVKAAAQPEVLRYLAPEIDGFAVSSLFEARLVHNLFSQSKIHFTAPGIRPEEIEELNALCSFVSLNSSTQVNRFGAEFSQGSSLGIRINTRISSVPDQRYDPCRRRSKLGIPIEEMAAILESAPAPIHGLHIHTNADSSDFCELLANVQALVEATPKWFEPRWVNLGGGYLFEEVPVDPLIQSTDLVKKRLGADVFLEPGAGLVRGAGFLVARVVDKFEIDGSSMVVLDATVNHMPEVLEFDYSPDVKGHLDDGAFKYTLAGSSCLAGDIFGTYGFSQPLEVGSRVVFEEAGAYTLVKAHRFNGINLPEVGVLSHDGRYRTCKTFTYQDFTSYWTTNV